MTYVITILLFSALLGFLTSMNLFVSWFGKRTNVAKLFFSIYLFFLSMIILDIWESMAFNFKTPWVLDAYGFLGPASYFFILTTFDPKLKVDKKRLLLFAPGVLEVLLQVLRIFDFYTLKSYLIPDAIYANLLEYLEIISFGIAILLYGLLLNYTLNLYKVEAKKVSSRIVAFFSINMVIVLIWGLLLFVKIGIVSFLATAIAVFIASFIIVLVSDHIRNPELLYTFVPPIQRQLKINKNPNASFDLERIVSLIAEERLFLDSDFNLKTLSLKTNLSKNYISTLLNHKAGKPFRLYLNELRIAEAMKMLQDTKFAHLSILGIAYEVGYKSESTFYEAFKKFAQCTPREFKTRLKVD